MTLQGLKTAAAHCAALNVLAACAANDFYVAGLRQQLDSGSLDRSPVQAPAGMTELGSMKSSSETESDDRNIKPNDDRAVKPTMTRYYIIYDMVFALQD